jgi:hypothetical protein
MPHLEPLEKKVCHYVTHDSYFVADEANLRMQRALNTLLSITEKSENHWRTEGVWGGGVQPTPPPEIPMLCQN